MNSYEFDSDLIAFAFMFSNEYITETAASDKARYLVFILNQNSRQSYIFKIYYAKYLILGLLYSNICCL